MNSPDHCGKGQRKPGFGEKLCIQYSPRNSRRSEQQIDAPETQEGASENFPRALVERQAN